MEDNIEIGEILGAMINLSIGRKLDEYMYHILLQCILINDQHTVRFVRKWWVKTNLFD